jgi:hypothetical protein
MKLKARLRALQLLLGKNRSRRPPRPAGDLQTHRRVLEDALGLELAEPVRLTRAGDLVASHILRAVALLVQACLGATQFRKSGSGSVVAVAPSLTEIQIEPPVRVRSRRRQIGARTATLDSPALCIVGILRFERGLAITFAMP